MRLLQIIKDFFMPRKFPRQVRIVYRNGGEAFTAEKKPYIYAVSRNNTTKVYVPLLMTMMPYRLLENGGLTPDWNCQASGPAVDYMQWFEADDPRLAFDEKDLVFHQDFFCDDIYSCYTHEVKL